MESGESGQPADGGRGLHAQAACTTTQAVHGAGMECTIGAHPPSISGYNLLPPPPKGLHMQNVS